MFKKGVGRKKNLKMHERMKMPKRRMNLTNSKFLAIIKLYT